MTVGWILEGDINRFLEARYPVLDEPISGPTRPCPFCTSAFDTLAQLYIHLHHEHVVRRPYLLLGGREPSGEHVVRHAVKPTDIHFGDTYSRELSIDGQAPRALDETLFVSALSDPGFRALEVCLFAAPMSGATAVSETYKIKVRIASDPDLEHADRAFVRLFGLTGPHIKQIDEFMSEVGDKSAADYAEGLSEYVRGVLLKDRAPNTGVRDARSDWKVAFERALQVLSAVKRPLSTLVSATISFALNDFSRWHRPSAFPSLDFANILLGPLTECVTPLPLQPLRTGIARSHVCPIDAGSDHVLQFAERCSKLQRWSAADESIAEHLATSETLGAFDRVKVLALWALFSQRLASPKAARKPLSLLLNNDAFGGWAERELGETQS